MDNENIYNKATDLLKRQGCISAARIQRGLGVGYCVAEKILEELIKKEITTHIVNKPNLRVFEKVKQFTLLKDAFSVENGLMSATQKVKRNKVFEKYEKEISKMYK